MLSMNKTGAKRGPVVITGQVHGLPLKCIAESSFNRGQKSFVNKNQ